MSWMDFGDVRKARGGRISSKKGMTAEDAKLLAARYKKAKGSKSQPTLTRAQERALIKKAKDAEKKLKEEKRKGR